MRAPEIKPHWALFLDLDGTLLDIAASPEDVVTPSQLPEALERVGAALGGALAVVSGRSLGEVDHLLKPLRIPVAAEHGALIRLPSGALDRAPETLGPPRDLIVQLRDATRDWSGVLVEEKTYSVAVHFRLAPEREDEVKQLVMSLADCDRFELLTAKKAFEVRPKGITKGRAVRILMADMPFRGRQPVFVGDDVTDEDGMEVARQLGGFGLRVGSVFQDKPAAVRDWLKRAADTLG